MKKSFYIILGIVITVTIAWYIFLYNSIGRLSGICVCLPITEDTYQGPNWPTLFPGGCVEIADYLNPHLNFSLKYTGF